MTAVFKEKHPMTNIAALAVLLSSLASSAPAAGNDASALQGAFVDVSAKAKPAVVNITVVQEEQVQVPYPYFFFGDPDDAEGRPQTRRFRSKGTGSGFLIDSKGYIVTNDHVVGDATKIQVTRTLPDGKDKTYPAKVVGHDPNLDLAVVKIEPEAGESLPALKLASSAPRVGEWAIAIGSPFALEQTVTVGVISAQRQSLYIENRRYPNMIQTDAAINRGNSGGPLLNLNGDVVGVNTAIYSPSGGSSGIGFAIPATEVQNVLGYLLAGKRFRRGWMGIETMPVDEVMQRRFALPTADGALVNRIFPNSPAAKAGLKRGDVIRRLNATAISTPDDLISATSSLESGKKADLQVYRQGVPMNLQIALGERPDWADNPRSRPAQPSPQEEAAPQEEEVAAFTWQGVTFARQQEGVVVAEVGQDSAFAESLQPGDVVRAINNAEVADLDGLRAAVKKVKLSDGIFFDLLRHGQPLYLSVKP